MSLVLQMSAEEDIIFRCQNSIGLGNPLYNNNYHLGVRLVEFFNVDLINPKEIEKDGLLDFCIKYGNLELASFTASNISKLCINNDIGKYFCAALDIPKGYDSLMIGIISAWSHGISNIHWKNFDTKEKKRSWLVSCLLWQSIVAQTSKMMASGNITIPLDQTFEVEDFFVFLGRQYMAIVVILGRT